MAGPLRAECVICNVCVWAELELVKEDTVVIFFTHFCCMVYQGEQNDNNQDRCISWPISFMSFIIIIAEHFSWILKMTWKPNTIRSNCFLTWKTLFIDWLFMQCWDNVYFCTELRVLPPVYDRAHVILLSSWDRHGDWQLWKFFCVCVCVRAYRSVYLCGILLNLPLSLHT